MTCMVSSSLNRGWGNFFKLFSYSNDFITQKVYFWLMRVYTGLVMFGVYLVQVSLLLIGQ